MRRVFGTFVFALGVLLGCWLAYNLLFERQKEFQASLGGFFMVFAFLYVGYKWMRDETAG